MSRPKGLCYFYQNDSCTNRNCVFEHEKISSLRSKKNYVNSSRTILSCGGWNPDLITQVAGKQRVKVIRFGSKFGITDSLLGFLASTPDFAKYLETFEAGARGTISHVTDDGLLTLLQRTPQLKISAFN